MPRARDDLARLVAFRSVANPDVEPVEECAKAAAEVARLLSEVGVEGVRAIETADGSQAVVGHTPGPAGAPTVLLYAHYDVQPAGELAAWDSSPWELTERDGRWFGRGAADCKGNLVMLLSALRALPRPWPVGIRVVCEGSEEMSTGGLEGSGARRALVVRCRRHAHRGLGKRRARHSDGDHHPARDGQCPGDRAHAWPDLSTRACTAAPRRMPWQP